MLLQKLRMLLPRINEVTRILHRGSHLNVDRMEESVGLNLEQKKNPLSRGGR